ncbi:hypothetical protein GCM10009551_053780 [Nocardiopsis tropica]|uniref:hypothetical protein n=1 Tax=Tsukamurella strandjordii TaxID=147577 RepID=UPI0031E39069
MQGDRYVRQMMMAMTAAEILRREPSRLSDPRLRDRLENNYAGVQGEFYDRCYRQWMDLLSGGDVDLLTEQVTADTEFGGGLRTLSPLGTLIPSEVRQQIVTSALKHRSLLPAAA